MSDSNTGPVAGTFTAPAADGFNADAAYEQAKARLTDVNREIEERDANRARNLKIREEARLVVNAERDKLSALREEAKKLERLTRHYTPKTRTA